MNNLSRIWELFDKNLKVKFIFLIVLILLGTFFEMFSLSLLIPITSIIYDGGSLLNEFANKLNLQIPIKLFDLNIILSIFIILYLMKTIYLIFVSHYQINFIFTFFTKLLNRLFRGYIYEKYLFHIQNKTPELVRNLMGEIHKVSVGYVGAMVNIILESIIIIGVLSLLFIFQPNFIIVVILLSGLIISIVILLIKKKISSVGTLQQKYSYLNLKYAFEALGGIKEIKVANVEEKVALDYKKNSLDLKNTNYFLGLLNALPRLLIELGIIMIIFMILLLLNKYKYSSDEIITFLTLTIGVFIRIFPSINKISVSFINLNFYKPSIDLLFEKLVVPKNEKEIETSEVKMNFKKDINLKNINFLYPNNKKKIIDNLNLKINKYEKIGIMGQTGSGKTTLVNIIIGLLNSQNGGLVEVDGNDIQKNLPSWFRNIGYVPQQVYLNNDTIKNNIAFYEEERNIKEDKIWKAIEDAQLLNFLKTNLNDLNYILNDDGKNISGGQRQRIGIARALYKDSELLIFDESTNSLDEATENKIVELIKMIQKKTIIIISHKKNVLKYCNKVYLLKDGKLRLDEN